MQDLVPRAFDAYSSMYQVIEWGHVVVPELQHCRPDPIFIGGTVTRVVYSMSKNNRQGYGYVVEIDHGGGYRSLYAHLAIDGGYFLNGGDTVAGGQRIGTGGQSGNAQGQLATEAHLHLRITRNDVPIDPIIFLNSLCPSGVSMSAPK